jgi:hypothetical protein
MNFQEVKRFVEKASNQGKLRVEILVMLEKRVARLVLGREKGAGCHMDLSISEALISGNDRADAEYIGERTMAAMVNGGLLDEHDRKKVPVTVVVVPPAQA